MKLYLSVIISLFMLAACSGNPIDVMAVSDFNSDRYLGNWYEVARLDHSFERGLTNVTANYTKRDDGKFTVLNRGYSKKKSAFEEAIGKAKFAKSEDVAHLKVSFFGPFYGDYIVFGLDKENYSYAYISGGKDNYLWLLSRTPEVSDVVRQDFLQQAKALGYPIESLIWVEQSKIE